MKINITFSLDLDDGQARLTPRSEKILDQMVERADLLDYDLVMDMYNIIDYAFQVLQGNYDENDEIRWATK
jgi:hypothetical protein